MNSLDNQVLVLNSSWVACDVRSASQAFTDLAGGAYAALDIQDDYMVPTLWKNWLKLPVRPGDDACQTPHMRVRVPRVLIALNFKKVPVKRIRCNLRNVAEHYDNTCALTGRKLKRSEMSIEHVNPRSKGGKDGWENTVLAHREINSRRGDRPYEEVGLKPPKIKSPPKDRPVALTIVNSRNYSEWNLILGKK